jgi:hypothetical protein
MDEEHQGLTLPGIFRIRVSDYRRNAIWDHPFGPRRSSSAGLGFRSGPS